MPQAFEVPSRPFGPFRQSVSLSGITYNLLLRWCEPAQGWLLDISDSAGNVIATGLPLVTGHDLLDQYAYLAIGGKLIAQTDQDALAPPTFTNFGSTGHLYYVPSVPPPPPIRRLPLAPGLERTGPPGQPIPQPLPPGPPPALCLPSVTLGPPPPIVLEFDSEAYSVSADGLVVIGSSRIRGPATPGAGPHAFRWTVGTGMVDLGVLPGYTISGASHLSSDGSVVAGICFAGSGGTRAFRWTQAGGMVDLGALTPGAGTTPLGISADGSIIIGQSGSRTFRWTQAGGMVDISSLGNSVGGSRPTMALSMTSGGVVVEQFLSAIPSDGGEYGSVYTLAGGEVNIDTHYTGVFMGAGNSYITGINQISDNGSVAFGFTSRVTGGPGAQPSANLQRWGGLPGAAVQTDLGTLDFTTGLPVFGETFNGYSLLPYGISSDGSVVAGHMVSPQLGEDGGVAIKVFVWTSLTGVVDIGDLGGVPASLYNSVLSLVGIDGSLSPVTFNHCVSADGSTVVGISKQADDRLRAFRWTFGGGMLALPTLGGNTTFAGHIANGISQDASVIVGSSYIYNNANFHAFRWTQAGGIQDLGTL